MRPIELTIKNFLSYGEIPQTVNFADYTIISFIGNNGHGKSAILESITWSLWGMARKSQGVTKSDDMIMHTGSNDMFVSLIFQVKNQLYHVKRSCQKKHNRLYSSLEFFLVESAEKEKNLSLAHQKETQHVIDSVIGIDYETFINTVYLKQGQSNEFSKKTPKERKDILCSILKINEIEKIRETILVDVKALLQERTIKKAIQERFCIEEKSVLLESENKLLQKIEHTEQDEAQSLKENEEELKKKKHKLSEIELILSAGKETEISLEKEISALYTQYCVQESEYKKYKKYFIETVLLLEKTKNETTYDENLLQEKIKLVNEAIESTQKKSETERTAVYTLYKNQLLDLQQNTINNEKTNEPIKTKEYLLGEKAQIEEIVKKCKTNISECFFCKKFILENDQIVQASWREYQEKITTLENRINEKTIERNQKKEEEEKRKEILEYEFKKNLHIIKKHEEEVVNSLKQEKIHLEEAYKKALALFKDEKKIELYLQEIKEIKKKIDKRTIKKIIIDLYNLKKQLEEKRIEKERLKKQQEHLSLQHKDAEKKYSSVKEKKDLIEKQKLEKKQYISFLQEQLIKNQAENNTINKALTEIEKNLELRSTLAQILSKNNLQAALIEEAIPLIESEANNILEKLTEGTCKIYIDSMKDLKSGEIKETLDIKIADAFGLRYYEFFSGGESFKIDLALRIALVKLLTQKSGHAIRTFIIDEGFGSQDTQSLEKIIDILYGLQNEFDLIILISHLTDMKEQFPGQFFIRKTPTGSVIQKI